MFTAKLRDEFSGKTAAGIAFAATVFTALAVYGPLWPVGRLLLLRSSPQALVAEGINNPQAQRMFSRVALLGLLLMPLLAWAGAYDSRWYAAAACAALLYGYLTYIVFELSLWRALGWVGSWFAAVVFAATLAGTNDPEDDGPTPAPAPHPEKMGAPTLVGILFVASLALALVWTAVSEIFCRGFNFCT